MREARKGLCLLSAAFVALLACATGAYGYGEGDDVAPSPPAKTPPASVSGNTLAASATASRIKVTQISGGSGRSPKPLAPVDPNWQPPACWYEPVATPQQLRDAVGLVKTGQELSVLVTPSLGWGPDLLMNHYDKGVAESGTGTGYKNYNLGKDGMFWRGVINPNRRNDIASADCERIMFWQNARTLPNDKHAPTPDVLAAYAYNQINVPQTQVELKPATKSTVNAPTWVWLDKAKFTEVKVRAELPEAGVWAETTAKPVALHLNPGTSDSETYPSSGDCAINADGSVGTPYTKGDARRTPPCGITYLRASSGQPYQLKASITWQISWEGSGGAKGDLPDGTFETTQDVNVQEIQAVNR